MRSVLLLVLVWIAAPAAAAQRSEAFVEQVGVLHAATLVQNGSYAQLTQRGGSENTILLQQTGGAMARILQEGTGNRVFGLDALGLALDGSTALQADGSSLFLSQIGTGNTAYVQQALGAVALITQLGTGNTATIIQM